MRIIEPWTETFVTFFRNVKTLYEKMGESKTPESFRAVLQETVSCACEQAGWAKFAADTFKGKQQLTEGDVLYALFMIFTEGKSMLHCASDAGTLGIFYAVSSPFTNVAYDGKIRRHSVYKMIQSFSNATIVEIDDALMTIVDERLTLPLYFQLVFTLVDKQMLTKGN